MKSVVSANASKVPKEENPELDESNKNEDDSNTDDEGQHKGEVEKDFYSKNEWLPSGTSRKRKKK